MIPTNDEIEKEARLFVDEQRYDERHPKWSSFIAGAKWMQQKLEQCNVSGSLPLDDFISEVERMQKLYSNSRYTSAEELRDKLAEQLDDIMRLGGNYR